VLHSLERRNQRRKCRTQVEHQLDWLATSNRCCSVRRCRCCWCWCWWLGRRCVVHVARLGDCLLAMCALALHHITNTLLFGLRCGMQNTIQSVAAAIVCATMHQSSTHTKPHGWNIRTPTSSLCCCRRCIARIVCFDQQPNASSQYYSTIYLLLLLLLLLLLFARYHSRCSGSSCGCGLRAILLLESVKFTIERPSSCSGWRIGSSPQCSRAHIDSLHTQSKASLNESIRNVHVELHTHIGRATGVGRYWLRIARVERSASNALIGLLLQ
jgi:hypothetical protein